MAAPLTYRQTRHLSAASQLPISRLTGQVNRGTHLSGKRISQEPMRCDGGKKEGGPSVKAAFDFTLTGGKPPQRSSLMPAERVGVGIVSAGVPSCSLPLRAPSFL